MSEKQIVAMQMMIKDINVKTLVSGDKQARVVLQTLHPNDVEKLNQLTTVLETIVAFEVPEENG